MKRLLSLLILTLLLSSLAPAALTPIQDILYRADDTLCSGYINVSWSAFTSTGGLLIASGSLQSLVTNGVLSVALEPGQYIVDYSLSPSGCQQASENWIVPTSTIPVDLATVRSLAAPTTYTLISLGWLAQGGAVVGQPMCWLGSTWGPGTCTGAGGSGVFNVMDYGAVGTGTVDDTIAIQAAVTAAEAVKGLVYFPQGVYKLTTALIATAPSTWQGAGPAQTFLLQTSTTANGITVGPGVATPGDYTQRQIFVRDLQVVAGTTGGNAGNSSTGIGIYGDGTNGIPLLINNVIVKGFSHGIRMYDEWGNLIDNTTVLFAYDTGIEYTNGTGGGGGDLNLNNVTISNNGIASQSATSVGLHYTSGGGLYLSGRTEITHFHIGFQIGSDTGSALYGIYDQVILDTNEIGLYLSGTYPIYSHTFSNSWFSSNIWGAAIDTASAKEITIDSSRLRENTYSGLKVTAGSGITVSNSQIVANNRYLNTNFASLPATLDPAVFTYYIYWLTDGSATSPCTGSGVGAFATWTGTQWNCSATVPVSPGVELRTTASDILLVGNTIGNIGSTNNDHQAYGVAIYDATVDYVDAIGNKFTGNTVDAIASLGSVTHSFVEENPGYNSPGGGGATAVTAAAVIGAGKVAVGDDGVRGVIASTLSGVGKFTAGVPSVAAGSDIVALWTTCSGYLKSDGTCDTPTGTVSAMFSVAGLGWYAPFPLGIAQTGQALHAATDMTCVQFSLPAKITTTKVGWYSYTGGTGYSLVCLYNTTTLLASARNHNPVTYTAELDTWSAPVTTGPGVYYACMASDISGARYGGVSLFNESQFFSVIMNSGTLKRHGYGGTLTGSGATLDCPATLPALTASEALGPIFVMLP
jgi:hypothetical protein